MRLCFSNAAFDAQTLVQDEHAHLFFEISIFFERELEINIILRAFARDQSNSSSVSLKSVKFVKWKRFQGGREGQEMQSDKSEYRRHADLRNCILRNS